VSEQYATDVRLRARMDLHARFSTAKEPWQRWVLDRVAPPADARILEVGCGPAELWKQNLDRLDSSWSVTLLDLSPGMLEAARDGLGDRADYVVADVGELPFAHESFDLVLANHMLYHVPDRPKAFAEIRRVLVHGGAFYAALNGRGHLEELRVLVGSSRSFSRYMDTFALEDGPPALEPYFTDIRVEQFDTALVVTEVEAVLDYVRSSESYDEGALERVRRAVEDGIERDGVFRITTTPGLISCRKP
jgi:ubiquinone/menaquinone biosynthesis C-methylase UbiE